MYEDANTTQEHEVRETNDEDMIAKACQDPMSRTGVRSPIDVGARGGCPSNEFSEYARCAARVNVKKPSSAACHVASNDFAFYPTPRSGQCLAQLGRVLAAGLGHRGRAAAATV